MKSLTDMIEDSRKRAEEQIERDPCGEENILLFDAEGFIDLLNDGAILISEEEYDCDGEHCYAYSTLYRGHEITAVSENQISEIKI